MKVSYHRPKIFSEASKSPKRLHFCFQNCDRLTTKFGINTKYSIDYTVFQKNTCSNQTAGAKENEISNTFIVTLICLKTYFRLKNRTFQNK